MEVDSIIILKRTFSDLGKLQQSMDLQYQMVVKSKGIEFCVSKIQNGKQETECHVVCNLSKQEGKQILSFMHENSIPFESWKDVLRELVFLV